MPDPTREEMIEALRIEVDRTEGIIDTLKTLASGALSPFPIDTTRDEAHLAALRAVLRELEAGGWRPINEYPIERDPTTDSGWGPNVLLFVPTGVVAPASDYRIVTGRLEADMWLGWSTDDSMYDIEGKPSHFARLPAPPAASDGGER